MTEPVNNILEELLEKHFLLLAVKWFKLFTYFLLSCSLLGPESCFFHHVMMAMRHLNTVC